MRKVALTLCLLVGAVLYLGPGSPGFALGCTPGSPEVCQQLRYDCIHCDRDPETGTCTACEDWAACNSGYYVESEWSVRVGHRCGQQTPSGQACGIQTLFQNFDRYWVRVETEYWQERSCFPDHSNSAYVEVSSSWEANQYCWYQDGYCGNVNICTPTNGCSPDCRFSILAANPVCN